MKNIQLIIASSILGLKPTGVEQLATALLKTEEMANAPFIQTKIEIPNLNHRYKNERDPGNHCLNVKASLEYAHMIKPVIEHQVRANNFSLVLGGDCSILTGIAAGLKSCGNYALIYLDAHADFYEPQQSTTGELADMSLSIVVGKGIESLSNIERLASYFEETNVFHIGQRDQDEIARYAGRDITHSNITKFSFQSIQRLGIQSITSELTTAITDSAVDGVWIHFDTDVIDDEENPAVDYRLPGGLTFKEAGYLIAKLVKMEKSVGLSVTIYNPNMDKQGVIAKKISNCIMRSI